VLVCECVGVTGGQGKAVEGEEEGVEEGEEEGATPHPVMKVIQRRTRGGNSWMVSYWILAFGSHI
jgi:hypothetical protein